MSAYCHDCGTVIDEDDISLCPRCANRREVPMQTDLIERAEAWMAGSGDNPYEIIRDLLAVVKRLPRTADGVPVVPGMNLYAPNVDYDFGVIAIVHDPDDPDLRCRDVQGVDFSMMASDCTAAEQARPKQGEKGGE